MAEISTSVNNEDKNFSFDNLVCGKCNEEFTHDKAAKLLHCLHTFCSACLESHAESDKKENENGTQDSEGTSSSENKLKCPECKTVYTADEVAINPFLNLQKKPEPRTEDGSPSGSKFPICTSCDDNQKASSFCIECEECLCDPCVIAHKRVRLTKDHTISNQVQMDQIHDSAAKEAKQRQMYCKIHKMETLKLFCLTCETLTCRDCQLLEHKDHKYQFIEQTIDSQKSALEAGIKVLKERLASNKELSEKMSDKEKNIKKQQVEVFNEVRQVADTITNELISWCKQLLNFLQGVCHSRMRDLSHKKKDVDSFAKKASHTIKFVEAALASGDDLSVLYAKSFMSKSISTLQGENIIVPNTMFDLNIKYENDAKFLTKNVSKMGFINVNGKSYPQQSQPTDTAPVVAAATAAPTITPESFSKNVAEFLSKFQPHVKERYVSLPDDKRKQFLQQLMYQQQKSMKQQQQQQQQQQPPATQGPQNGSSNNSRPGHFNTDSGAIQDLYGTANRQPPPLQQGRPRAAFYQDNHVRGQMMVRQLLNEPPHLQPRPGLQPLHPQGASFQQWRGSIPPHPGKSLLSGLSFQSSNQMSDIGSRSTSQSLQNLMNLSNRDLNLAQPPGYPPNGSQGPPSSQPFIPRDKLPPGRIDIDPLNLRAGPVIQPGLRVKQEPKENPSCQFSSKASLPPTIPSSPTIAPSPSIPQSPTSSTITYGSQGFTPSADFMSGLQSPPPNNHASPSLTPSPCHSDGAPNKSASPAATDINQVMDNDRNELLKGLTQPGGQRKAYYLQPNHDPNDPSEDYCRVCHNGGDLLCCEKCPKVFHLQCHIPAISNNLDSSEAWICSMCTPDEELVIRTPIPREFELNSNGKRKAPNGLVDKEIKVCERVLLQLFCLESSTVFHEPVPKSVPNYHKVISRPMDFGTIKCKLRRGHFAHYNSVEEFLSDVKVVFRNCYKFNPDTSEIYQVGKSVEAYFESLVRNFLPCYLPHLNRRTPSPSPALMDSNGGGDLQSKTKKRKSPAPDGRELDSPVHIM